MTIVSKHTIVVIGRDPDQRDVEFFQQVVLANAKWVKEGRPLSNQG